MSRRGESEQERRASRKWSNEMMGNAYSWYTLVSCKEQQC